MAPYIAALLRGGAAANHAIERLRYIGPRRAGPPLRALLESGGTETRIAVSSALIVLRDPDSAPALVKRLKEDSDWEVRRNAAQALGELDHKPARDELVRRLSEDPHRRVRRACARALGKMRHRPDALARSATNDPDLEVRIAALDAVREMSRRVAPQLRKLLADESGMIRFAAARSLAWSDDDAARDFLSRRLTDEPEEQRRAVMVLADLDPRTWTRELLVSALECSDNDARLEAAIALARRGAYEGVPVLAGFTEGPSRVRAGMAMAALRELSVHRQTSMTPGAGPGEGVVGPGESAHSTGSIESSVGGSGQ